jgi:predicted O-methyltransferase YrrM
MMPRNSPELRLSGSSFVHDRFFGAHDGAGMEHHMVLQRSRLAHAILSLVLLSCLFPAFVLAADRTSTKDYSKAYSFTKNSFTDKVASWTKMLGEFAGKPDVHYLEIGTYEGRSALWVLEHVLTHPTARLTIIDAFEEHTYKRFIANVNLSGEAKKFRILSGFSTDKIREVPLNSVDFAYIDGSGRGIVMLSDLVSTWNVLKVGGIIICSRYSLTGPLRRALGLRAGDPGPHEAIDAFLKMYNPYISVLLTQGNQVMVRKRRQ